MNSDSFICRAKLFPKSKWINGYIIKTTSNLYIVPATEVTDDDLRFDAMNQIFPVSPESVCRATGKTDVNNAMIFENDFLKVTYLENDERCEDVVRVTWSDESASFSPWDWEYICDGCDCSLEIKRIEVIGNFFDNPAINAFCN